MAVKANEQLNKIDNWLRANKLYLSTDKTNYSIFSPTSCTNTNHIDITIGSNRIMQVSTCKYLGVVIDDELTFKPHIDLLFQKLTKFVGIFYKLRYKLPSWCLRNIYYAFIHPHILYGIEIYGNTYPSYLDKLTRLNNKILKILQNQSVITSHKVIYPEYNTLPPQLLHKYQILILVHKFLYHKHLLPIIYLDYFTLNSSIHDHNTRGRSLLHLSQIRSSYGHKTIHFLGSLLWNALPPDLKELSNTKMFKQKLKIYLLSH